MRRWAIILLTLITAFIHLYLYLANTPRFLPFLLNGIGYLGLLGLLYLPLGLPPSLKRFVRPVFIGYTLLTIVLYIILGLQNNYWTIPLGPITKVVEIILVVLLWQRGET